MHSNLDLMSNAPSQLHGNWWSAILVCATLYAIPILALWTMVSRDVWRFSDLSQGLATLLVVYLLLLAGPLMLGASLFFIGTARGQHPSYATIFKGFREMWRALATFFLILGIGVVGYALFVVPGVIASVGLSLAFFVLADNPNATSQQALSTSWALVWRQSRWWKVFFLLTTWIVLYAILAAILDYLSPYVVNMLHHLRLQANDLDTSLTLCTLLLLVFLPLMWASVASLYEDLATTFVNQPDRGTEAQALLGARHRAPQV
eukprot:EG_transcript_16786